MANDIIPFDSTSTGGALALPEHLQALFGDEANITPRFSINQLSYRGKIWRTVLEGEEVALTRPSQDNPGETEPMPVVSLIVMDHNKNRSRSFYEGNFEEGKNASPRCFSNDGIAPDASVKEPCSATCATCPNSVKGSKITENGRQVTACAPNKRIVVIPSARIGQHPAMLLRIAQTSVWDKDNGENEAKGWYAWDQYLDMLRARGAKHTAIVETRVKFDLRVAYPKLLFSASRWLNPEEAALVKQMLTDKEKEIADILSGGGFDGAMGRAAPAAASEGSAGAPAQQPQTPAATPKPTPAVTAAPKAAPKPPATPAPTQAPVKMVKTMTEKAEGVTYKDFIDQGWTDEQLIENGYMVMKPEAPKAPAAPKAPKAPKAPATPSANASAAAPTQAAPPAAAPAQTPAAAPAATVGDGGTPAALSELLEGWDDADA